jgi:predicted site-specific integrase-resolvase
MLHDKYPSYEVIQDVGSGLNFQRPGLTSLLEHVYRGDINEIVVMHKDRLCRYGLPLLEFIFKKANVKLVVLSTDITPHLSREHELADDLIAITTVFVARHNGQRSAANRKRRRDSSMENSIIPKQGTDPDNEVVVGSSAMDI